MTDLAHPTRSRGTEPNDARLVMPDGFSLPASLYEAVARRALDAVPALRVDTDYTAEMLCGPDLWKSLSKGERSMAGRCIAYMVCNNLLPLEYSSCRHEIPRRYRLK